MAKDKLDYKNLLHNNEYIIAQKAKERNKKKKEVHQYTHTFVLLMQRGVFFLLETMKRASLLCFSFIVGAFGGGDFLSYFNHQSKKEV